MEVAAFAGYESGALEPGSGGVSPAGPSFSGGQRTSRMAPQGYMARRHSASLPVPGKAAVPVACF